MSIVKLLYRNNFDSENVSRRIIERLVPDQQIPISTNETTLERIIEVKSNELPVKITSCRIKSVNYTKKSYKSVSTSNHKFGKAIWDKLPECIFENFEIARVKRGQFQNFQKSRG